MTKLTLLAASCALVGSAGAWGAPETSGARSMDDAQRRTTDARRDAAGAETRSDRQATTVAGELIGYRTLQLRDAREPHVLAKVRLDDGGVVVLDLGKVSNLQQQRTRLQRGMQVRARGASGRIDGRPVLVVSELEADGERTRVTERSRERNRMAADGGRTTAATDRRRPGAAREAVQVQQAGDGIRYLTGGIGNAEQAYIERNFGDYSMQVVNVRRSGEAAYVSDVDVQLSRANGETLFDVTTDGPWLLADLPRGRYELEASFDGQARTETFRVRPGESARMVLAWEVDDRAGGRRSPGNDRAQRDGTDQSSRGAQRGDSESTRRDGGGDRANAGARGAAAASDDQAAARRSTRQQVSARQGADSRRMLSGEITGMKDVRLRGVPDSHRLVRIETPSGRSVVVDLGTSRRADRLGLAEGDTVMTMGQQMELDGRTVLRADRVAIVEQMANLGTR